MVKAEITPGRAFYDRQLAYLAAKDVDGLVENQYAPNALLVRFDQTLRGHDQLKAFFQGYIEMLGDLEILSTDQFSETENTVFFEATQKVMTEAGLPERLIRRLSFGR